MTVASARAGDAAPGAARAPSAYGAPDGGTSLEPGRYAQGLTLPGRDVLAQTESLRAHQVTAHCEMLARTSSCLFRRRALVSPSRFATPLPRPVILRTPISPSIALRMMSSFTQASSAVNLYR